METRTFRPLSVILVALLSGSPATGHEVPPQQYDRILQVHLLPGKDSGSLAVEVAYRLEVAPATIVTEDAIPFREFIDIHQVKTKLDWFAQFVHLYGPVVGQRVLVQVDGRTHELECVERSARLDDEKGEPLGHLRCDWRFRTEFPRTGTEQSLLVRERNYPFKIGTIDLTIVDAIGLPGFSRDQAPEALRTGKAKVPTPEEQERLRTVRARWRNPAIGTPGKVKHPVPAPRVPAGLPEDVRTERDHGLLDLFLHSELGIVGMLFLAAAIGAVHALTPGHGKTLVAAYLVGQRGTIGHACVLGLVTTLTHTGIVLLLAAGLLFLPENLGEDARRAIEGGIGLALGLAIFCLGIWLLLQRLSGRADHFHLGAGHHHHHHPAHESSSLPASSGEETQTQAGAVTWWGLILLGITGGIVPCWDAIAMLVLAVGMNLFWLALPMLLAFSAGLAGVLVLLGILVVKVRGLAGSRWGEGRLVRSLPILSACFIALMGMWLCWEGVKGLQ